MTAWGAPLLRRRFLEVVMVVMLALNGMLVWRGIVLWDRFTELREATQRSLHRRHALQGLAERLSRSGMGADLNAALVSADSEERVRQQFLEELGPWIREGEFPVTVRPQPLQREGAVVRLMTELGMEATQEHLVRFLDRVLGDGSMVSVERFRLAPSGVAASPVRATFVLSKPVVQALPEPSPRPEASAPSSGSVPPAVEQAPSIATAASRPLFRTRNYAATPSSRPPTDRDHAMAERLQVVGMITGSPSQAILEDAQTRKTYVVGAGQSVGEGIIVEAIQPHGVVLSVGGEPHELSW